VTSDVIRTPVSGVRSRKKPSSRRPAGVSACGASVQNQGAPPAPGWPLPSAQGHDPVLHAVPMVPHERSHCNASLRTDGPLGQRASSESVTYIIGRSRALIWINEIVAGEASGVDADERTCRGPVAVARKRLGWQTRTLPEREPGDGCRCRARGGIGFVCGGAVGQKAAKAQMGLCGGKGRNLSEVSSP